MVTDTQLAEANTVLDALAAPRLDAEGNVIEAKEGSFVQDETDIGGEPVDEASGGERLLECELTPGAIVHTNAGSTLN